MKYRYCWYPTDFINGDLQISCIYFSGAIYSNADLFEQMIQLGFLNFVSWELGVKFLSKDIKLSAVPFSDRTNSLENSNGQSYIVQSKKGIFQLMQLINQWNDIFNYKMNSK